MEGPSCIRYMSDDKVMPLIEAELKKVPLEERAFGCDDAEIEKYCGAFRRLLEYCWLMFFYCHQPYGTLTDTDLAGECYQSNTHG